MVVKHVLILLADDDLLEILLLLLYPFDEPVPSTPSVRSVFLVLIILVSQVRCEQNLLIGVRNNGRHAYDYGLGRDSDRAVFACVRMGFVRHRRDFCILVLIAEHVGRLAAVNPLRVVVQTLVTSEVAHRVVPLLRASAAVRRCCAPDRLWWLGQLLVGFGSLQKGCA